jgi:hypothetical protein
MENRKTPVSGYKWRGKLYRGILKEDKFEKSSIGIIFAAAQIKNSWTYGYEEILLIIRPFVLRSSDSVIVNAVFLASELDSERDRTPSWAC